MCGIAGILRKDGNAIPLEWLDILDARIAHRGPDGRDTFFDRAGNVAIAFIHRRLAIIDIEDGAQPMVSERGRDESEGLVAVVFNGCIYNHRELRKDLQTAGHTFQTDHSDTEILIHGYREWREELEHHLEGMYAFAIWDKSNARLVLSRDTFGEKPLYINTAVGGNKDIIAFSSDARSLYLLNTRAQHEAARGVAGSSDSKIHQNSPTPRYIERYLQLGYTYETETVYSNNISVSPPTIAAHPETIIPARPRTETSQAEFEKLLDSAVASRLEADVPLGCFLSGGVDSSLLAALAIKHKPDLQTFSVRMPDPRYDESEHAEFVADQLGTRHTTLDVAMNPADDLVHLIHSLGQPFGDSSILPTYWVSKAARKHVKVAISGDGADELFFGYDRYIAARALWRHRRALQWLPRSWFGKWHPKSKKHKLGRFGEMARDTNLTGVLAMESIFSQRQIAELLGRPPRWSAFASPAGDPMLALRNADLQYYLPSDLLTKVDTASMAVALEVRAPYLDSKVVEAAVNCPTWTLASGGKRKYILKEIAGKYLPRDFLDRSKMGFAIPIGEWFRTDFGNMRTLLLDHINSANPFGPIELNNDAIQKLLAQHDTGDYDHGQRLFTLLTLSIWAKM